MNYRLIALDVDGTLLDSTHRLRPRVAAAVRAAIDAGIVVTLATGKLLNSVQPLLREMGVHGPQIVLNGAATQDGHSGKPLRFCPLREDDRRAVLEAVRATAPDLLISHFALDAIYMDDKNPLANIFDEYGEGPPLYVPDLLGDNLPPAAKILISGPPERLAVLRTQVTPLLADRVSITTTTPDFLEFFDPAAGKGLALADLRGQLGLQRAAVVAMGDGENDLPLFREAGMAVAMANSTAVVRAAAQRIAPSNDEDGVAVIIEELLDSVRAGVRHV